MPPSKAKARTVPNPAKVTKAEADYSDGMAKARCGDCGHFRPPYCEIVAGLIDPDKWCKYYIAKRT